MHRRIERAGEALDAPSLDLVDPVEIGEVYVNAGRKAASATLGRARVACPHADGVRTMVISHLSSFSLIKALNSGT